MIVSFRDSNIKNNDDGEMKSSDALLSQSHRLQGMRMRDEFLCPITYELLREPVVSDQLSLCHYQYRYYRLGVVRCM